MLPTRPKTRQKEKSVTQARDVKEQSCFHEAVLADSLGSLMLDRDPSAQHDAPMAQSDDISPFVLMDEQTQGRDALPRVRKRNSTQT